MISLKPLRIIISLLILLLIFFIPMIPFEFSMQCVAGGPCPTYIKLISAYYVLSEPINYLGQNHFMYFLTSFRYSLFKVITYFSILVEIIASYVISGFVSKYLNKKLK